MVFHKMNKGSNCSHLIFHLCTVPHQIILVVNKQSYFALFSTISFKHKDNIWLLISVVHYLSMKGCSGLANGLKTLGNCVHVASHCQSYADISANKSLWIFKLLGKAHMYSWWTYLLLVAYVSLHLKINEKRKFSINIADSVPTYNHHEEIY